MTRVRFLWPVLIELIERPNDPAKEKGARSKRTGEDVRKGRGELAPGLRHLVVSGFTVFYRPLKEGIVILRVLHSRQDVEGTF